MTYLKVSLEETHSRLVSSNDHHQTLRLQGEARELQDTLKLIDRAETLLNAHKQ
ncbi:hypothetical protein [Salinisphaera sp. G21_0]|uniref:hypothetical protein n=1 Tax=Salinisphaera sp. G21_0 TaxID=2821094 RepID=UPI001ADD1710|nr:hypothetical protein [Salinisphaera sp. G21_0]MBO9483791.1 hypothetical protein [Salinisphaera sp. G21_0]